MTYCSCRRERIFSLRDKTYNRVKDCSMSHVRSWGYCQLCELRKGVKIVHVGSYESMRVGWSFQWAHRNRTALGLSQWLLEA